MATTAVEMSGRDVAERTRTFRTDIQSLRALAIAAVVLNHLWPLRFTGGYVGVDVFFVISGFLITGHLLAEIDRTGSVRLGRFYARRVRRLLPAALLVLAAAGALVYVFLPYPRWERNAAEIAAAALYVENWVLTGFSVDYSAANEAASAVQHYWSLSVEEQFYVVWPVLLLALAGWGVRHAADRRRRALLLISVIGAASFAASVVYTQLAPNAAYFVTFTRMWEFALGGLVAVLASRIRLPRRAADLLSLLGFAGIVLSIFLFGPETPFPGWTALLPVLSTVAVIAAGTGHDRLVHSAVTAARPVQWVGDVSYSLYLWHWPLIVVAPFVLAGPLSTVSKIAVLVASLALAWLTHRLVERPAQRWRWWSTSTRRAFAGMAVGMVVILGAAGSMHAAYAQQSSYDLPDGPLRAGACVGPAAIADAASCPDAFGPPESAVITGAHVYWWAPEVCRPVDRMIYGDRTTTTQCDFSRGTSDPTDVWLVGDSHAEQWQGPLLDIAERRGWRLTISHFGGCPPADVPFAGFRTLWGPPEVAVCRAWSRDVSAAVVETRPDLVFTSMAGRFELLEGDLPPELAQERFAEGLVADWDAWADAGSRVFAIVDPPLNGDVRDPDCVLLNPQHPLECARPRAVALPPGDPLPLAVEKAARPEVRLIDLTDAFCDDQSCFAVIGGEPVYYDADHVSRRYSRMLADRFESAVDRAPGT